MMNETMKETPHPLLENTTSIKGRWLYILALLVLMHITMDARYRIAGLFTSMAQGFAFLGALYLFLSISLTACKPLPEPLFRRLDSIGHSLVISSPLCRLKRHILYLWLSAIVLLMIGCGVFARWIYMTRTPIAAHIADMLPLIQQACDTFVSGSNPYRKIYEMPWELPLTFWPGMWLPYLPLRIIDTDIRWLHLGIVIGISAIFGGYLLRPAFISTVKLRRTLFAGFAGLFLFLFSSEPIFFTGIGHTAPQWAWSALLAATILAKRPYLMAVSLGLLLTSRQTAVVLVPLVTIYWFKSSGSLRSTSKYCASVVATYLFICAPFLLPGAYEFLVAPIKHYSALGQWDFTRGAASYTANTIGLSYTIRSTGGDWLLLASMFLAIALPVVCAQWRMRNATDLLLHMSLATVAITLVSPIPWHYEYFPAFLFVSFAAIGAAKDEDMQCQ